MKCRWMSEIRRMKQQKQNKFRRNGMKDAWDSTNVSDYRRIYQKKENKNEFRRNEM